jgi:predicted O-methyltransferase YrrM
VNDIAASIRSDNGRFPGAGLFADMPDSMLTRMRYLEAEDARQRREGLAPPESLCQIPPETGRFLALLAMLAPQGAFVEIGTSGGYSTMWLSRACRLRGVRVQTFEMRENKAAIARETFRLAGIEDWVDLAVGDVLPQLSRARDVAFVFMDHDKKQYPDCYEHLIPNMVPGAILVADNVVSHRDILTGFVEQAMSDNRVDAVPVAIGKGLLVCRKR